MIVGGSLPVPAVADLVDDGDYARLLGYPDRRLPAGRVRELAARSRAWFAREAEPWAFARRLSITAVAGERIELEEGVALTSPFLARRFGGAAATALVAAAVSSGPEVDAASAALWQGQRPDEAYFLDRFGVAVAEHLAAWTAEHLHYQAHDEGLVTLPGYSPGFPGWPLTEQVVVAHCLDRGDRQGLPGPLEVLASGAMAPSNSLLAVFGLTASERGAVERWQRDKCSWCTLAHCAFRRRTGAELAAPLAAERR